ncbi:iron complex outermembrane recepter protein [Cnuella takakiae]|uniref:Iron complex outermembrane recepter protein n=1 Tax=Cnuella takakiae TaxID=1302690 RepID=A0A1M4VJM8_9BACT|nr:TonB-dependent receptor plug domain-containing protein [Cnuella takakiae]OLY92574.1 TonB-dependent receptor [Cnuella takakiae]SHE69276.1 iron complex outermembrane recepter protein [Cnuella takakiae]
MKRTALFLAMSAAMAAGAQEANQDTTEMIPVEVRATRAGVRAPFTKTNIRKAEIEQRNLGQDLPFLLNQTPSVVVNSDAGNGVGYTGIRVRGTDATRINITLNGIPFNDAESQGSFFVNLPDLASSASSIQIQRGVGTSSNGPGAFGATVNLSTVEANDKAYAEFNNSYGSFNTWKNTLRLGTGKVGKYFSADLRLSNITSDGFIDRATSDLKSYYFATAFEKGNSSLRFISFSGKEKTYQAWNGVTEADLKSNRTVNYAGTEKPGTPYQNETDNYGQTHYQLFFNQKINSRLNFNTGLFYVKGAGYYEQYKADRRYSSVGLPNVVVGNTTISRSDLVRQLWLDNDYYGNVFSLNYQANKTELTLGGMVSKYEGNHFGDVIWAKSGMPTPKHRFYDLNAWKNDATVYAKWQQEIAPYWQLYTDLQLRTVHYRIDGFRDNPTLRVNNDYAFLNPKAGVSYNRNGLQFYGSYGLAQKEPNRDDFEAGAARQPRPEKLHDFELGLNKTARTYNWGITGYYMAYKDQLVLTGQINDVGAYTRTNIDRSYRLGVELQGGLRLNRWAQLSANLAISRNKVVDFTEYVDDYDQGNQKQNKFNQTDIAFSPNLVGAGQLQLTPVKNLELNLNSKYVGRQYLDNTQQKSRSLEAFFVQDAQARYNLPVKGIQGITLVAQVNNLFNKMYAPNGYTFSYISGNTPYTENYYFPMAGTNWMFGVNVKL